MEKRITIEQLQEAIKDYQVAVDAANRFTYAHDYEDYLESRNMNYGLCNYFGGGLSFIGKYLQGDNPYIYIITAPRRMTLKKMRFCVEIRLITLKWELGLRLAEIELAKNDG